MKKLFKEAHKLTREIKAKYNDVDYKTQFKLCLQMLVEDSKKDTVATLIKKAEKVAAKSGYNTKVVGNDWVKGQYNRTYIEIRYYNKKGLVEVKKCGFFDNVKCEYIAFDKYTEVLNLAEC